MQPYEILKIKECLGINPCDMSRSAPSSVFLCGRRFISKTCKFVRQFAGIGTPHRHCSVRKSGLHETVVNFATCRINRSTNLRVIDGRLPPRVILQFIFLEVHWSSLSLFHTRL